MSNDLSIDEVLGEGGLIDRSLDRYEFRPQQLQMANAIAQTIKDRKPLVVEAATGTGKTLAYLTPALLSGLRVIVSTGTKALQEQLFHKDIPFLQKEWPTEFDAVLLKGRRNYLCRLRYAQMKDAPAFRSRDEARLWPDIMSWASKTTSGDRAEIDGLPDDWNTWNDLSVGAEACLGTKCEFYETCFVTRARQAATKAELIVVNHHLYFADLAIRDSGFGELLPEHDLVIFDEAHHLESVATSYFGMQMSNWRIKELIGDIERGLESEDVDTEAIDDAINELDKASASFFSTVTFGLYDGRYSFEEAFPPQKQGLVDPELEKLLEALQDLSKAIVKTRGLGEVGDRLIGRCKEHELELRRIMNGDDARYVYFVEIRDRGCFIQAAPIDLAHLMREKLLAHQDRIVFTSATLATGGSFDFFEQRMGIRDLARRTSEGDFEAVEDLDVTRLLLPPVFDYETQALVYVPRRLPDPKHPEYIEGVCTITKYLLDLSDGRAFVLFTSYRNLNAVWDELHDELEFPLLKQGDKSRRELLDEFRKETRSVLFATSSFWEGVDVEGDSLSMVIIDKLPFANPSDPLTRARLDLLDTRGKSSFFEFSVPQAALTLKQGFGRLIRSSSDQGVVAVLDSRICHKSYGRHFLDSLPPAPVVFNASEVRDWWKSR